MKYELDIFDSLDLKPVIDMLEPPHWWLQLWQVYPDLMVRISLTIVALIIACLASFHIFAWLLRTGRIPEIERRLNEWDMRRTSRKERERMKKDAGKENQK